MDNDFAPNDNQLLRSNTLRYVVILITLWVGHLDECIPYLESLPRDAFEPLSTTEGLVLLMFFFFSAPVEPGSIRDCLALYVVDGNLFQRLGELINAGDINSGILEPLCNICVESHRAPTCPACTRKIAVALRMFTLLFTRGLTIRTQFLDDENLPPPYSLTEKVIDWILVNSAHIELVTVRNLYRPLLRHYQEQSDGYFFLLSLVTQIFEDPETTEYYGNVPLRMEFLMELLPVLELREFFKGTHCWTTCPALVIFPPHRQFFEAEDGWETTDYHEDSRVFFPQEEDFDPRYVSPNWRAPPWNPRQEYPFPDVPEGQYFDPQYRERWNLWQHIVQSLRDPIALPPPEDAPVETSEETGTAPAVACSAPYDPTDGSSSSDDEGTDE